MLPGLNLKSANFLIIQIHNHKDFDGIEDHLQPVVTGFAALVTSNSATLNETVNPNGVSTECFFEYGTDTTYGPTTA